MGGSVALTLVGCGGHRSASNGPELLDAPESVGAYQLWEAAMSYHPAVANPFDGTQAQVTCTLRSPAGRTTTVQGFYFQDYVRSQAAGQQVLTARGAPQWRIRFAPTVTGPWTYAIAYRDRSGVAVTHRGRFWVVEATAPGFVEVSASRRHHLVDGRTGEPYLPIGENMCWPDSGGTYDYDGWMGRLGAAGGSVSDPGA
jgi:hypothetical protein